MGAVTLFTYQYDALGKMNKGSILCGGVGSGKSRTALAKYYTLHGGKVNGVDKETGKTVIKNTDDYVEMRNPRDLYIITTARKRDDLEWEAELPLYLMSTHPECSLYKNKIVIDSWNNIKKYKDVKNACFIFDEQRVVGYGAWSKAFIRIARNNWWVLLTATPGDDWMDYIPVFVANGFYANKTEFTMEHVVWRVNKNFRSVDRYLNTGRLIRLRNKILVNMEFDRKTISHHEQVLVDYNRILCRWVSKNKKNPFQEGFILCEEDEEGSLLIGRDISAENVKPILLGWDFVPEDGMCVKKEFEPIKTASEFCSVLRKIVNSDESRAIAVLELVEKHPRAIIFYNYDYELEILKSLYYGNDVEVAEWNGHKHQPIPETDSWVYLVQYTAGAEGWNCIKTDTIIFFSQNYSYKIMVQSSGRIDRLNTPYTDLYYYHLRSASNIDICISRALREKKKFNEGAFAKKFK